MPEDVRCTKCGVKLYTAAPMHYHGKIHDGCGGSYYATKKQQGERETVNLHHVSETTRKKVEDILNNPTVHYFTKLIIREGLGRDCVDAAFDSRFAAGILKQIMEDTLKLTADALG